MSSDRQEDWGLPNVVTVGLAIRATDPVNDREGEGVTSYGFPRPNRDDDEDDPYDDDDDDDDDLDDEDDDDDLDV